MSAKDIASQAFSALPHINKVWVDESKGVFHLHDNHGGVLVERESKEAKAETVEPVKPQPKNKK